MNAIAKKEAIKWTLYILGGALVLYLVIVLVRAIGKELERGANGVGDAIGNVFSTFSPVGLWNSAANSVRGVFNPGDYVADTETGEVLGNRITANENSDYAPGGRMYNKIAAEQSTAAANAAWVAVQEHQRTAS